MPHAMRRDKWFKSVEYRRGGAFTICQNGGVSCMGRRGMEVGRRGPLLICRHMTHFMKLKQRSMNYMHRTLQNCTLDSCLKAFDKRRAADGRVSRGTRRRVPQLNGCHHRQPSDRTKQLARGETDHSVAHTAAATPAAYPRGEWRYSPPPPPPSQGASSFTALLAF